ncbi:MAG: DUF2283 domain-containing protein [candidate division KSB1 bacterium]|nr:DUF2283 domain-containing protein [candidate division KSB1 bacterium]
MAIATPAIVVREILAAIPHLRQSGAKHVWFDFDDEADVLYISFERPQNATDTDMLDNGVFIRLRGKKIAGLTITNFSHKFKN